MDMTLQLAGFDEKTQAAEQAALAERAAVFGLSDVPAPDAVAPKIHEELAIVSGKDFITPDMLARFQIGADLGPSNPKHRPN